MSKRDWRNGLALGIVAGGGLVLVVFLFGQKIYDLAKCDHTGQCNRSAAKYEGQDFPSWWWWDWTGSLITSDDTLAQWVMSFFTIAAVILVWRTLVSTQQMAAETTRIGEAQVRAYITFDSVKARVKVIGDSVQMTFSVKIRNSGQSPARRITATAQITQGSSDTFYFRDLASGESEEIRISISHDYDAVTFVRGSSIDLICAVEIKVLFCDVFTKTPKIAEKSFFMSIIDILGADVFQPLQQVGEFEFSQRGEQS